MEICTVSGEGYLPFCIDQKGLTVSSDVAGAPGYVEPGNVGSKSVPHIDLFSTNFTCGRNAFDSAAKTETADVIAGTEIGFRVNQGIDEPDAEYVRLTEPSHSLQIYGLHH
jgi:hypothetical protein